MKYFLILPFFLLVVPAHAESISDYVEMKDLSEFILEIDDHVFTIPYSVDADILAMAIDPELNSLLIGLANTQDSVMVIDLDHKLIDAENLEFAVLVNGFEVNYAAYDDADSTTLRFFIPSYTEEVEIIGTYVIPEFPIGALATLMLVLPIALFLSKTRLFML